MNQHWEFSREAEHPYMKHPPRHYFKKNFFISARGDEAMLPALVALLGDENILFNTDYPHPDGTWPWGIEKISGLSLSDETRLKILGKNASRLFATDFFCFSD